jgi:hypothetical protein
LGDLDIQDGQKGAGEMKYHRTSKEKSKNKGISAKRLQ